MKKETIPNPKVVVEVKMMTLVKLWSWWFEVEVKEDFGVKAILLLKWRKREKNEKERFI